MKKSTKSCVLTSSADQTRRAGKVLGRRIIASRMLNISGVPPAIARGGSARKGATIIYLKGDLGSGKTTFLQGLALSLGVKERVLSPTFILARSFSVSVGRWKKFYHIDCYRIKGVKELKVLGWERIVSDDSNIAALEWADKIKDAASPMVYWVSFSFAGPKKRKICFSPKLKL